MNTKPDFDIIYQQLSSIQKTLESWNAAKKNTKTRKSVAPRESQKKLLEVMKPDRPFTTDQLARKAHLKRSQVNRAVSHLIAKGIVEPLGRGRGVYQLAD